jgi:acetylornithine deacetylase/succinyl-diaminopimelate desuccinylase-like protein
MARLSASANYNSQLRTTCVATMLEGGHASNALPQSARAIVNCRVLPGEPIEEVEKTLRSVLADEQMSLTRLGEFLASPPSPLRPDIVQPIEKLTAEFWPGIPVIPSMSSGATDGRFLRNAGIPTYGHSGLAGDVDDVRIHGRDERVGVKAFDDGLEYLYRLVKTLSQ